jgi:hypothetical protein
MGDEEYIGMHPVKCDGGCGRQIGWSDETIRPMLICNHCMDHPDEVASRLGIT